MNPSLEYYKHQEEKKHSDVILCWNQQAPSVCVHCKSSLEEIGERDRRGVMGPVKDLWGRKSIVSQCRRCFVVVKKSTNEERSTWFSQTANCDTCSEDLLPVGYLKQAPIYTVCKNCYIFVPKTAPLDEMNDEELDEIPMKAAGPKQNTVMQKTQYQRLMHDETDLDEESNRLMDKEKELNKECKRLHDEEMARDALENAHSKRQQILSIAQRDYRQAEAAVTESNNLRRAHEIVSQKTEDPVVAEQLIASVNMLATFHSTLENEKKLRQEYVTKTEEELRSLRAELDDANRIIDDQKAEIAKLSSELETLRSEAKQLKKDHAEQLQKVKKEYAKEKEDSDLLIAAANNKLAHFSAVTQRKMRMDEANRKANVKIAENKSPAPSAKVVILGETGVGKTSLIGRFYKEPMCDCELATIKSDMFNALVSVDYKRKVEMELWDTSGSTRHIVTTQQCLRDVGGAIIVFDVTTASSFGQVQNWIDLVKQFSPNAAFVIAGNKIDKESRVISEWDARNFAQSIGAVYYETSAKTNKCVDDIFGRVCQMVPADYYNRRGGKHENPQGNTKPKKRSIFARVYSWFF
jgi:small GTP-binding protein